MTLCALLLLTLTVLCLLYWFCSAAAAPPPPPPPRRRPPRRIVQPEPFEEPPAAAAAAAPSLRELLDFSDPFVTEECRRETAAAAADAEQIQSANERFAAAKRTLVEHKLKTGVYNQKQRRRLVETLLRRPQCGRRVRSWRTENSDFLRGDVRPKAQASSSNILRSAKGNANADLHPGALGPMAGLNGLWLSEENLPGNLVPEGLLL